MLSERGGKDRAARCFYVVPVARLNECITAEVREAVSCLVRMPHDPAPNRNLEKMCDQVMLILLTSGMSSRLKHLVATGPSASIHDRFLAMISG